MAAVITEIQNMVVEKCMTHINVLRKIAEISAPKMLADIDTILKVLPMQNVDLEKRLHQAYQVADLIKAETKEELDLKKTTQLHITTTKMLALPAVCWTDKYEIPSRFCMCQNCISMMSNMASAVAQA